jgi:hypothetical protein
MFFPFILFYLLQSRDWKLGMAIEFDCCFLAFVSKDLLLQVSLHNIFSITKVLLILFSC